MAEDGKNKKRNSVFGKLVNAFKGPEDSATPSKASESKSSGQTAIASDPSTTSNSNVGTEESKAIFSVDGKAAIVTGAGSGINFCFAKLLLEKGCSVLIADLLLRPEAQVLVDKYSGQDAKPKAQFVKTDVTEWSDLQRMFDVAYSTFGALDIVCAGAGVFEPLWSNFWHPPGSAESKDTIDGSRYKLIDINITHPIRTSQLAIANFLNPPKGDKVSLANPKRILALSSIAGQAYSLPVPMYHASKWAVSGFIRSLGDLDSKLGIKSAAVAPGLVKTPLFLDHPEKMKMIDQEKDIWVTPEEVAEAMLKCVEDESIPSGTILECGSKYTRQVQAFNDPGFIGRPGVTASLGLSNIDEVYEWLAMEGWGKPVP